MRLTERRILEMRMDCSVTFFEVTLSENSSLILILIAKEKNFLALLSWEKL